MIRILPDQIANLIAAGEVVERPAAVIKELVENALDAGARNIEVEARDAGFSYLRVTDDGSGMVPDDARLAFRRHATSKLSSAEDLNHIQTLGFRGEALPSIASVARVELTTRPVDQPAGFRCFLEAGVVLEEGEAGCAAGTTIVVKDLFFNTPARRKFMKSPATERSHLIQTVEWCALAHPNVRFRLLLDGKETLNCPATDVLSDRVLSVLGRQFPENSAVLEQEGGGVWVRGLAGSPAQTRPTRSGLLFFINQRPIEHRSLAHAVLEAYRPYLTSGRFPACLVFLTIPEEWVDVNVHPTKREVRLRDEHAVHDLVMRAVRTSLGTLIIQGQEPTEANRPIPREGGQREYEANNATPAWSGERVKESVATYFNATYPARAARLPLGFSQTPIGESESPAVGTAAPAQTLGWPETLLGQAGRTYLAGSDDRGFFLIDQHAAHERILYERFRALGNRVERQNLLLPITLELTASRGALLQGQFEIFAALGFEISAFGKNTFVIRTQPPDWSGGDLTGWVAEMLDYLAQNGPKNGPDAFREHALHSMACHAAVKAGDRLQPEVARLIWEGIQTLEPPLTCPHGRPLILRWDWGELDRLFKRT